MRPPLAPTDTVTHRRGASACLPAASPRQPLVLPHWKPRDGRRADGGSRGARGRPGRGQRRAPRAAQGLAVSRVRPGRRRAAAPPGKRRRRPGLRAARAGALPAADPVQRADRPGRRPGHPPAAAQHHLAGDRGLRGRLGRRGGGPGGGGPDRAALGGRARHRAERRRRRGGQRPPGPGTRDERRQARRRDDQRLCPDFPGAADRPGHGGRHGRAALPGPGPAAPRRGRHRPGCPGRRGQRPGAAAQRGGKRGHRLDGRVGGAAAARLAAGPSVRRRRAAAAAATRDRGRQRAPGQQAGLGSREVPGDRARRTRQAARHRGLRPGRRRRQAADQGGPVPVLPGLRADVHHHPPAAGRARGLPDLAGGPGGRRRARAARGGDERPGQGRAGGLPGACRAATGRRRPRRHQR